jgi:uncharacterized protein with FMN-binding domain
MSKSPLSTTPHIALTIRKFLLSFFVVFTFIAYAIGTRMDITDPNANSVPTVLPLLVQKPDSLVRSKETTVPTSHPQPTSSSAVIVTDPKSTVARVPTDIPTDAPTDVPPTSVPAPTATPEGQYKDGTYDGPVVDAYYGNVQVEAIIRGGKITDVQFLDYPKDRRTSRSINQRVMPWLTQEAVQVQNANVDLISGATFTSQAFAQSLQSALDQAHA